MGRIAGMMLPATFAVALLSGVASAADFSGAWLRDNARSKMPPYPNYWLTRSQPSVGGNANAPFVVQVQQTAVSVRVTDPTHPVRSYTLDGKGRSAPTDSRLGQVTTSAAMQGEALVVTTSQPYGGMPGNATVTSRETWSLSPDGKLLTIATVNESPATRQTYTQVFSRQ